MGWLVDRVSDLRGLLADVQDRHFWRNDKEGAVGNALASAGTDQERAWVPNHTDNGTFIQPDRTTCGSSTLVMSKMRNDPAYAMWVRTGYDPETGETAPADQTATDRFAEESLSMHDRTNAPTDRDGARQLPWPKAIGSQPWAVAHEMSAHGGSGVPGTEYGVRVTDPDDRGSSYDEIAAASKDGHTVPLYVGNTLHPGHVVLVTGSEDDTLTIYEPASGETETVSRDDFVNGDLGVAGWDEPWFAVTPR